MGAVRGGNILKRGFNVEIQWADVSTAKRHLLLVRWNAELGVNVQCGSSLCATRSLDACAVLTIATRVMEFYNQDYSVP